MFCTASIAFSPHFLRLDPTSSIFHHTPFYRTRLLPIRLAYPTYLPTIYTTLETSDSVFPFTPPQSQFYLGYIPCNYTIYQLHTNV